MAYTATDKLAVQTIRTLSIDAIEAAKSGHPGLPMGAAPMAYVLWTRLMRYNPKNPGWFNRDRFVLSAGHGSALVYSLLHLAGFDVTLDDLKSFRKYQSKTPGHPEYGHTPGVDATTGPLGQGISMAVGMAMAERYLAARFNCEGFPLVDHNTYVIVGDGDMMEGVQSEAASLAGHLGLNKLIVLYDSNDVSLDGPLNWSMTENVADRYRAYGWNVLRVDDGNDMDAIERALETAKAETSRPTLIEVKTVIGYGSPSRQGTSEAHGKALGPEETAKTKAFYGWSYDPFTVPEEVRARFAEFTAAGIAAETRWNQLMESYGQSHSELAQQFVDALHRRVDVDWNAVLPEFSGDVATRDAFGKVLNAVAPHVPTLVGGSADLSGSNMTIIKDEEAFQKGSYHGKNFFYGVREHAMGAILNGMSLHGGVIPFGGTFLVFCDYLRPALRLAALMKRPVIHILTHDSIAVGEDGPTHEPVEQIASLRIIPGFKLFRPADGTETSLSFKYALTHGDGPVGLALTRQKLPTLDEVKANQDRFDRGAYVIFQHGNGSDLALMASGSEVQWILATGKQLAAEGVAVRVISVPCLELYDQQDAAYQEAVLPKSVTKRLAVEMAVPMPWYKHVGSEGSVLGIDRFGASGDGTLLVKEYGFSTENVLKTARALL